MGIHDRHYIRRDASSRTSGLAFGSARSFGRWSVNTWIIVLCVAVFVLDGFLPMRFVSFGAPRLLEGVDELPANAVLTDEVVPVTTALTSPDGATRTERFNAREILASPGGPLIGWQHVKEMHFLESVLHFSSYELFFNLGFWRVIGFQFLHSHYSFGHILLNMIALFFFGPMVEQQLGSKRYLAFYLLCGICGALLYGLLNVGGFLSSMMGVKIPGLLFNDMATPLVGASAGVFGVLMAGAFLAPNATVLVFFLLPMRLKTMAYILVAIAFFTVLFGGGNAGGEAGHLGGAIAGFYFIRHPHHLHGFFDILGRIDPTSRHFRGRGGDARGRAIAKAPGRRAGPSDAEIDRILDKLHSQGGLASLTAREKRMLREASERER